MPSPDADGLDQGGIRLPSVRVPLGTYTGWNPRRREFGAPKRLGRWQGSFMPFVRTEAERRALDDPRPSIAERYPTRAAFLAQTRAAAKDLENRGLLLASDVAGIIARAGRAFGIRTSFNEPKASCG